MGRGTFHQTRMLKAPPNLTLNTARDGTATASLGNLCQCLTVLMVKNFWISPLSLKPFPLVLSLHALGKSPSSAFLYAPSGTGRLPGLPGAFCSPHWTTPNFSFTRNLPFNFLLEFLNSFDYSWNWYYLPAKILTRMLKKHSKITM